MQLKQVTNYEYLKRMEIKGTTTINHRIRVQLKLSMEEYVMMDFIYNWNLNNTETPKLKHYFLATGYIAEDIQFLFKVMREKKLLIAHGKINKHCDVCPAWYAIFSTSVDQVNELWKILQKGNKPTVIQRLPKVLKQVSFDELKAKLIAYVKDCEVNGAFMKGLDVWLNPEKQHWNDPLRSQPINKPSTKIKFK